MRYFILVSHGEFAPGMKNALGMLAGERDDLLATSLLDGMDVNTYRARFADTVKDVTAEDEVILFGDLISGSPFPTALDVLAQKGISEKLVAVGGMNIPMVMTALFSDEDTPLEEVAAEFLAEGVDQIKRFQPEAGDEDDDI